MIRPACTPSPNGLERDLDAVTPGLTLPWSSGPVARTLSQIPSFGTTRYGALLCRPCACEPVRV
jgi:hypothetical protein